MQHTENAAAEKIVKNMLSRVQDDDLLGLSGIFARRQQLERGGAPRFRLLQRIALRAQW